MSEQRAGDGTDGALYALEEQVTALRGEVRGSGRSARFPARRLLDGAAPTSARLRVARGGRAAGRRRPQVPRLLLEGLFLVAAATAVAAVAELDAVAIAA